jgi:hypothetical protein
MVETYAVASGPPAAAIIPNLFIINTPSCIVLFLDEDLIDQTDYDFGDWPNDC